MCRETFDLRCFRYTNTRTGASDLLFVTFLPHDGNPERTDGKKTTRRLSQAVTRQLSRERNRITHRRSGTHVRAALTQKFNT